MLKNVIIVDMKSLKNQIITTCNHEVTRRSSCTCSIGATSCGFKYDEVLAVVKDGNNLPPM